MRDSELLYKLGQRLQELRKSKSLTLQELEAMTNIDNSNLSKYEAGSVNPKLTTLYKLSQAFGITLSELVKIE